MAIAVTPFLSRRVFRKEVVRTNGFLSFSIYVYWIRCAPPVWVVAFSAGHTASACWIVGQVGQTVLLPLSCRHPYRRLFRPGYSCCFLDSGLGDLSFRTVALLLCSLIACSSFFLAFAFLLHSHVDCHCAHFFKLIKSHILRRIGISHTGSAVGSFFPCIFRLWSYRTFLQRAFPSVQCPCQGKPCCWSPLPVRYHKSNS
jgi:hypothetical protein